MYTQYQQCQNQNSQYNNQQTVSAPASQTVGAAQWNGTSWVYPSNNNNNNSQQPRQQQIVPPNPVETFTQYYHGWTKREEELKKVVRVLERQNAGGRNDNERQTAESNRQWAKYYAEESSRAAHHFHQFPQATSAPFDLPPAPPTAGALKNNATRTNNTVPSTAPSYSSVVKKQNSSSSTTKTAPSNSSGSITRYVKRNIERPEVEKDPKLKAYVQSEIEKEIAVAIQKGTLQSKNWDLVPLIALPLQSSNATVVSKQVPPPPPPPPPERNVYQQQQTYGSRNNYNSNNNYSAPPTRNDNYGNSSSTTSSGNYYGPAASLPASSNSSKKVGGEKVQASSSYYGPASSHNNTSVHNFQQINSSNKNNNNPFSSSSNVGTNRNNKRQRHFQQQHGEEEDFIPVGYYGPSSSSSPDRNKKKAKKHQRKNKLVVVPTEPTHNGMDHSQQTMAKRANRFSGRGGIHEANIANSRSSISGYGSSKHDKYMGKGTIGGTKVTLDETDFEQMTVKGTSTTLEKEYLRLTAPPRAEFVRPFGILKQHLRNLQSEYYCCPISEAAGDDQNTTSMMQKRMKTPQVNWGTTDCNDTHIGDNEKGQFHRRQHDYLWFCSQLKAIRQDCTVQRIQGALAVDVYETHARIALQEGDLNEYNQCQTQLKELYQTRPDDVGKGSVVLDEHIENPSSFWKHHEEFIAYRILYYVFLSTNEKYSGGSSDIFHIMLSLTSNQRNHPAIRHALKVREAIASSDYFWFFRLHKSSPNLGVFLTELLVPTMRMRGLRRIAKAYRPSIDLVVCLQFLGFGDVESSTNDGTGDESKVDDDSGKIDKEGKSWLISCGGVVEGSKFVTKDSEIHAPDTEATKNSLI